MNFKLNSTNSGQKRKKLKEIEFNCSFKKNLE